MEIKKELSGAQMIFHLPERLDTCCAGELEKILKETPTGVADELIFDMTDTIYISSLGLRVMMVTASLMKKEQKRFLLRNVDDYCMTILRTMGLIDMFVIE